MTRSIANVLPRDQTTSLGVELVAIDSHWDNNREVVSFV